MPARKGTRPPNAGKGRPLGSVNKVSGDLRAMVLQALDNAGGVDYLTAQAKQENPAAFLSLVAKCLPKEVSLAANVSIAEQVDRVFKNLGKP